MSSSLQTIVDLKHVLSHFKVDLTRPEIEARFVGEADFGQDVYGWK
jgi:hypothetical protein